MKEIRESEWFGLRAADRQGVAPPDVRRPRPDEGRLRRHARGGPAGPRRARRSPGTSSSAWSPVPTRRRAAAVELTPSPVAPARRRARRTRCSSPTTRATPTSRPRSRELGARLLPGRRVRRAAAAVGARHPAARLGQPALLGAARLARRRPGPALDLGRRRGHRRDDVPDRQGARRRADLRADDRADPAPTTPPATCSAGWPRAGGPAGADPRRHRGRRAGGARAARRTASRFAPKITVEDARDRLDRARRRDRPADPGLHARARRLDDLEGERIKIGPVTPDRRRPAAGRAGGRQERRRGRHRHRRRSARRGQGHRARSRWRRPTGRAAYGSSRAPGSAARVRRMSRTATPDDVDEICAALPETELGISWGDRPTWKVPRRAEGQGLPALPVAGPQRRRPRRRASRTTTSIVITTPTEVEKNALVEDDATPFFTITTSTATTPCWSSSRGWASSSATSWPR